MAVHWGVLIFFCCGKLCASHILKPQIANPKFATNNPTLTTVTLEKPFCAFVSSVSKSASYEIHLYVMVDFAMASSASMTDLGNKPLSATFLQTNGGKRGPYKAATFNVPNCAFPPASFDIADAAKAPAVLTQYLIRVGNDSYCLNDPNHLEVCNPPLSEDTSYRFKFALVDRTADIVKDQTHWSDPIKTNKLKPSSSIDTWPGQRSGGMIAISFLLSVLMFIIAAAFLATLASGETSTAIRYQPQATQCIDLSEQEISVRSLPAAPVDQRLSSAASELAGWSHNTPLIRCEVPANRIEL
ncbi:uroplakin-3a isoform X2 [Heteronotia binoei]|uniref:uroplakin-3a isoform X2 n=1 Tax=Heteronotia binoei TaxID=13085 RepID=UPI00292CAC22|nr:uroplakin-3a isoform X2 [Heteronotia binoei]